MRSRLFLLVGATMALAAPAMAKDTAAKVAPAITAPAPGTGQVVFYRPSAMGGLISCRVKEGEQVVNKLPPGKYFVHQTTAGVHEYSVSSESKDILRVNVEDGETQYARCTVRMGIVVGRPNLSTQDRADFDKRGTKLKLQPPFAGDKDEPAQAGN